MALLALIHTSRNCLVPLLHASLTRLASLGQRLWRLSASSCRLSAYYVGWLWTTLWHTYWLLAASVDPFWVLLLYFLSNSFVGFLLLRNMERRGAGTALGDLDLFFTSVSAATVSSMSTVEMEALSRGQLAVLAVLMLVGGEVFTSTLYLHLAKAKLLSEAHDASGWTGDTGDTRIDEDSNYYHIELGTTAVSSPPPPADVEAAGEHKILAKPTDSDWELRYTSIELLGTVVFWYNAVLVTLGSASILLYLACASGGARDVLRKKGIHVLEFSVFLSVSSFANCGFVPLNENMSPFRRDSCLLLLIIPFLLSGNTLFPVCLRLALWVSRKLLSHRREAFDFLLCRNDVHRMGFQHLLNGTRCVHMVLTATAFLGLQFTLFCCMEWNSGALARDMTAYEKAVAVIFQSVNSRHAGESVFDLSAVSPAVSVLYIVMMYLPPYTSFSPVGEEEKSSKRGKNTRRLRPGSFVLSQLSCVAVFVILVCITERKKVAEDPLNFSVLSIVVEVVSAYGNVGFSTGYSCGRQLNPDGGCRNHSYGFVGWWSNSGKLFLVAVMLFGKLRKFTKRGGETWKLT